MPDQKSNKRPHLVLTDTSKTQAFKAHSAKGGGAAPLPELDRAMHGAALHTQLRALTPLATAAVEAQRDLGLESGIGLQIQFFGFPDVPLAFESLGNDQQGIELLSVWTNKATGTTVANVFVPDGKLTHFEKYVAEYLAERRGAKDQALDHKALINTISAIRAAELRALWTDDLEQLPDDPDQQFWWEVWLPVRESRDNIVADFRKLAALAEFRVSEHQANFPERTVLWMYGSQLQLQGSVLTLNCVAELRKAKDTAEFFVGLTPVEQQQWLDSALARLALPDEDESTPRICLLDSGVNRGHPLLSPLIAPGDLHTPRPAWGVHDEANHGTGLAGLALFGDMIEPLTSSMPIQLTHRLESVKLVRNNGANTGDDHSHAVLFADGVSQPETSAPHRPRVFATAVTASDYRDRGRPSSWSATVDRLSANPDTAGQFARLFILAGGNIRDGNAWLTYPDSLSTNFIHDPGQSWNAITVGAHTHKIDTEVAALQPLAEDGALSPYTTTSREWEPVWPLKPDVVMEGGNVAVDTGGFVGSHPSLELLTVNNEPTKRLFTTTNATSAASALCARLAAQLMAAYPALRPETIRALIVHSAEWTETMRRMYLPTDRSPNKNDHVHLIRHCGWGAPDLDRALWSAGNSLTLIVEDQVHPYHKQKGKGVVSKDMNLHALPWPKDALLELGATKVRMRVSLSYFIEPNPSARGTASKYHYPSYRLRYDVQRPLDASTEDFVARVNAAAAREDDGDPINPQDPDWLLGHRQRHRGSLHQDEWEGTAADLASRGFIAVYPANGWWRSRPVLERYELPARYSLIVSIRTEQTDIDLYTHIEQQIAARVAVGVAIQT